MTLSVAWCFSLKKNDSQYPHGDLVTVRLHEDASGLAQLRRLAARAGASGSETNVVGEQGDITLKQQ